MKWVAVFKSQVLEIDVPVLTQDSKGNIRFGKLVKQEKTKEGVVNTFELARFADQVFDDATGEVFSVEPKLTTDIMYIATPTAKETEVFKEKTAKE